MKTLTHIRYGLGGALFALCLWRVICFYGFGFNPGWTEWMAAAIGFAITVWQIRKGNVGVAE